MVVESNNLKNTPSPTLSVESTPIHVGGFEGEQRPWGNFLVLRDLPHYKLKQLQVNPGCRLSLQLHHQREEHWLVTQGTPEITVGDKTWIAQPGEYIFIPKEAQHRLANNTSDVVELVEVQLGSYFGEDDIVRLQDDYNRS
jgi:mannose-6-phosphate isomerase-like protein (cupin superfamily)